MEAGGREESAFSLLQSATFCLPLYYTQHGEIWTPNSQEKHSSDSWVPVEHAAWLATTVAPSSLPVHGFSCTQELSDTATANGNQQP